MISNDFISGAVVGFLGGVLFALIGASAARGETLPPGAFRVIDGDTVQVRTTGERIRLLDIDAAELHGGCAAELLAATAAKSSLETFLATGAASITRGDKDKYGRTLARIAVNGQDAGTYMLRGGYAVRYYPGHRAWVWRRNHWCGKGYVR